MKQLISEKEFLARIRADGTARIVIYLGHSTADVVIPAAIEGKPVTAIGGMVFEGQKEIKSVTIPDGVISIGEGAFAYTGLTSVTIGNSVTSIGSRAFKGCTGLTIYGTTGSAAEVYAKENYIPFVGV